MKLLMNLLLWTTRMEEEMLPVIENLQSLGFDGVEVPVFDTDLRKWQRWARRLDAMGLHRTAVTFCDADHNPANPSAEARRKAVNRLKQLTECGQALGANLLAGPIHSALNVFTGRAATADEWKWSVEGVRAVAEYAATCNVTIGVEYLNRFENYLVSCASDALHFVRDVDHSHCWIMFDTFHANIEEKNIAEAFRSCANDTVHIQISENDRSTPGQGHTNWQAFFDTLRETNYRGNLSIEAFGRRQPDLAAATKIWRPMFESEIQLARDGLAFLKSQVADHRLPVAG